MNVLDMITNGLLSQVRYTDTKRRVEDFKKYLKEYWGVNTEFLTPRAKLIFEDYEAYVKLPKENCGAYDKLTDDIKRELGSSVMADMITCTNFLIRNSVMEKKNILDTVQDTWIL